MTDLTPEELLKNKLNLETARVSWKELEVLFARGRVLLVSKDEDLVDIALAISNDSVAQIQASVSQSTITHPSIEWVKKHCSADTEFWSVVVAPWVLIQQA